MVKLMLDPGHDENTPGKGVAGLKEFHFNRAVVEKMIPLLKQYEGVEVFISHDMYDGIDQSLKYRTDLANRLGVDCFCSVHANAASAIEARGIETFVHPRAPKDTVNLGATVHGELIRLTGLANRKLKKADFHVIRETKMASFLVECGFMTNPGDLAKLKDDNYRQTCAQAIVNGLVQHYELKKKPMSTLPKGVVQVVKALVRGDIRKGPSHSAPYLRDHIPGEIFHVYKRDGDWHCVGGEKGEEYWIDGNKGHNLTWLKEYV